MRVFEVERMDPDILFRLVIGLVVPRPVGWLSTVSKEGVNNLAPFSFFNAVNDDPPVFIVSISDRDDGSPKDTVKNVLETGEFVVNILSEDLLGKMVITGSDFPPEVDEFKEAGLTPDPSLKIKAPRVREAKAWFECKLLKHERLYDTNLLFGEAVLIGVDPEIIDDEGRVDYRKLKPVGRLGGRFYVKCSQGLVEVE